MDFGPKHTSIMQAKRYTSQAKSNEPLCPAAYYCYNQPSVVTLPKGKWYMPTTKEVYDILDGVTYGTVNNRNADVLNATLNKLGASAISNGSYVWSCLRYNSINAWRANGYGFFHGNDMCNGYRYSCLALSIGIANIKFSISRGLRAAGVNKKL